MITVKISGEPGDGKTKLAKLVATILQQQGKVVRLYDDESKAPSPLPTNAYATIVVSQEDSRNGN